MGEWVETNKEVEAIISKYFQKVFTSSEPTIENIVDITSKVSAKLDSQSIGVLNKAFSLCSI